MGHQKTIFVQPAEVTTTLPLTSNVQSTTKVISKQLTLSKTNHTTKRSATNGSIKKTFTNGLTTNHHIRLSHRNSEVHITPPTTPPTTRYSDTKIPLIVECQVRARIPTATGDMFLHLYKNNRDNKEHLAVVFGEDIRSTSLDTSRPGEVEMDRILRGAYTGKLKPGQTSSSDGFKGTTMISSDKLPPPLVRIHSECFTGEIVQSVRCDCGEQLKEAMKLIQSEGRGVVIYLRQEGRGIGLADKLRAYNLQDLGHDTVSANVFLHHPPDLRTYDIATQILADLRLSNIRLLTNNPDKIEQVENGGIKVVERVPMVPSAWKVNHDSNHIINELDQYLKVKVERMRHLLNVPETLLN
ncbi:hypothetical protein Glove_63g67 [Diversispora epigaea]|uniref:GTP cyclohydrolase II n=1 Tax=Diversispora epigaea TaxID=1348612 RepID=A0A397JDJ6_9GLOM|nr:hypothetical protein Glove_63g67 [Diversispora epigaea]